MRAAAAMLVGCLALTSGLTAARVEAATVKQAPADTTKAAPFTCASFKQEFPAAAPGYRIAFDRPLTISRGFGDVLSGVEVYVLASGSEVDATLKCRGDEFLRFEARVTLPAKDKALADFVALDRAALMATFRWDRGKAETVEKAMSQDAGEYLKASLERGDIYNAGKVEYHQADRLDLGLIFTQTDHTFVISSQDAD